MASSADASLEGGLSSMRLAADKYRSILNDEKTGNTRWRYGGPPIFDTVNKLFEAERTHLIMATREERDKYRSVLNDVGDVQWRYGHPPAFDLVNQLFEEGQTKVWPEGSLEETVQNAIKSWEMELSHKIRLQDFKTINPDKFKLFVNGREGLSAEETLRLGSYNALLKTSLPGEFQYYKPEEESFESSHDAFRSALPRGFAFEILSVYSGPPNIAFKFRHWGYFEGNFKGHAPTGEMVQFLGLGVLKVDELLRAEEIEIYYDPGELFGGLLKGPPISETKTTDSGDSTAEKQSCPFTH
ncbi:pathogenesis-related family protein [Raphanus sativus]|nr:pathogenesis-related family protein [Raphanus sativus]